MGVGSELAAALAATYHFPHEVKMASDFFLLGCPDIDAVTVGRARTKMISACSSLKLFDLVLT